MSDLQGFNANEIPEDNFEPIPNGEYNVAIIGVQRCASKTNATNSYLELKLQVIDGEFKGRQVFDRLNIWNSNQTAARIAARTLADICLAIGKPQINDSSELLNQLLAAKIVVKVQDGYDPKNEVNGYLARKSITEQAAQTLDATPTQTQPAQTAAAAGGEQRPW